MKGLHLLVFILTACATFVCGQSQQEMNAEAARNAARADKELNQAYRALLATLDEEGTKLLKASQRAWIAYRDADAAAAADEARGGSMAPMLYAGTLARLTRERTVILRQRLTGEEGEVTEPAPQPPVQPLPPEVPVRRAEPLEQPPAAPTGGPAGAKSQAQAAQLFFDAYKAHDRAAAQSVAAESAIKKLVWKASAGTNPTLKLMDNTHIYYEGGSIELKMQKNAAGRWFIADVGLYAD